MGDELDEILAQLELDGGSAQQPVNKSVTSVQALGRATQGDSLEDLLAELEAPEEAKLHPRALQKMQQQSKSTSSTGDEWQDLLVELDGTAAQSKSPDGKQQPAGNDEDFAALLNSLESNKSNDDNRDRQSSSAAVYRAQPATASVAPPSYSTSTSRSSSSTISTPDSVNRSASAEKDLDDLLGELDSYKNLVESSANRSSSSSSSSSSFNAATNNHRETPATNRYNSPSSNSPARKTPPSRSADFDRLLSKVEDTAFGGVPKPDPLEPVVGTCNKCKQPIRGERIASLGGLYHPSCWGCASCNVNLGTNSFYVQDNLPYCTNCYTQLHCQRCAKCDNPILGEVVNAMSKNWHPNCFTCAYCNMPFTGAFFQKHGQPYCEAHVRMA